MPDTTPSLSPSRKAAREAAAAAKATGPSVSDIEARRSELEDQRTELQEERAALNEQYRRDTAEIDAELAAIKEELDSLNGVVTATKSTKQADAAIVDAYKERREFYDESPMQSAEAIAANSENSDWAHPQASVEDVLKVLRKDPRTKADFQKSANAASVGSKVTNGIKAGWNWLIESPSK